MVAALTEDESIEHYAPRKRLLRARVAAYGSPVVDVALADKIASLRYALVTGTTITHRKLAALSSHTSPCHGRRRRRALLRAARRTARSVPVSPDSGSERSAGAETTTHSSRWGRLVRSRWSCARPYIAGSLSAQGSKRPCRRGGPARRSAARGPHRAGGSAWRSGRRWHPAAPARPGSRLLQAGAEAANHGRRRAQCRVGRRASAGADRGTTAIRDRGRSSPRARRC
jgi:hypothetical protein